MEYKKRDYNQYIGFHQKDGILTVEAILEPRQCGCAVKQYCKVRCKCGRSAEKQLSSVIHEHILSCGKCGYKSNVLKERADRKNKLRQKYKCPFIADMCAKSEVLRLCCHECDRYEKCGNHCLNTPQKCGAKSNLTRREKANEHKNGALQ